MWTFVTLSNYQLNRLPIPPIFAWQCVVFALELIAQCEFLWLEKFSWKRKKNCSINVIKIVLTFFWFSRIYSYQFLRLVSQEVSTSFSKTILILILASRNYTHSNFYFHCNSYFFFREKSYDCVQAWPMNHTWLLLPRESPTPSLKLIKGLYEQSTLFYCTGKKERENKKKKQFMYVIVVHKLWANARFILDGCVRITMSHVLCAVYYIHIV